MVKRANDVNPNFFSSKPKQFPIVICHFSIEKMPPNLIINIMKNANIMHHIIILLLYILLPYSLHVVIPFLSSLFSHSKCYAAAMIHVLRPCIRPARAFGTRIWAMTCNISSKKIQVSTSKTQKERERDIEKRCVTTCSITTSCGCCCLLCLISCRSQSVIAKCTRIYAHYISART